MNKDTTRLLQQLRGELNALRERIATMETGLDELQSLLETEAPAPEAVEAEAVDLSAVSLGALQATDAPAADAEISRLDMPSEGVSTPGHGQGEGPADSELSRSDDEDSSGRGRANEVRESFGGHVQSASASAARTMQESTDRYAWRKDMPGLAVRDIRSAIALNDRVLFINLLFQQDAVRFQNALNDLNAFETFPQAEEYLRTNYPQWNYDSEVVYRFMMAVRRKLR